MKRIYRRIGIILMWSLTLLCMGFIFYMSSKDASASSKISGSLIYRFSVWFVSGFKNLTDSQRDAFVESLQGIVRTFGHFAEFTLLGFFMGGAFKLSVRGIYRPVLWTVGIGALYAISDEIHQLFVPGRAFQAGDIFVDICGVVLGAAIMFLIIASVKWIKKRKRRKQT